MSPAEVTRAHQALTERLAVACARHRWRVLIVWGSAGARCRRVRSELAPRVDLDRHDSGQDRL